MNAELENLLSQLILRLEGKDKCSMCGCDLDVVEAIDAGNGKLLCEDCYSKMEGDAELGAMEFESKEGCGCSTSCNCEETKSHPEVVMFESIYPQLESLREELELSLGLTEKKAAKKEKVSMKLGSGERFLALVQQLKDREDVEDPVALAAWIGRNKYGKKFDKLAAAGRKRAMKAKKK